MKILIVGVNGFIGSHLAESILRNTNYDVSGIDLSDFRIKHLKASPRFDFAIKDMCRDHVYIDKKIDECDTVLPLAAIATPKNYITDPIRVFELDFEANLWIVRQCVRKSKRLIFPSTSEVYGMCRDEQFREEDSEFVLGPTHKTRWIYSCSKQLLERIIWSYLDQNLEFTIFRPFNWIGANQDSIHSTTECSRVIPQFFGNLLRKEPILFVNGGRQKRAFLDINDGIRALMMIIENREASRSQIFNIGFPDNEYSIVELARLLIEKTRPYLPGFEGSLSKVTQDISASNFYGEGYQDMDRRVPSIEKIKTILNWSPAIRLEESLDKIISAYFKEVNSVIC